MMTVLGISPGTRHVGIALFREKQLIEWRTMTFSEIWSSEKLIDIVLKIEKLIIEYSIQHIALKVPHQKRSSKPLNELIIALKSMFERKCIQVSIFLIEGLKSHYSQPNKNKLAEYLATKESYLYDLYSKNLTSRNNYYIRMFEAIAAAYSLI